MKDVSHCLLKGYSGRFLWFGEFEETSNVLGIEELKSRLDFLSWLLLFYLHFYSWSILLQLTLIYGALYTESMLLFVWCNYFYLAGGHQLLRIQCTSQYTMFWNTFAHYIKQKLFFQKLSGWMGALVSA